MELFVFEMILLLGAGIFFILRPYTAWKISHWFSVDGGAPTERYLLFVRISGALFVLLAVGMLGVLFFC